MKNSGFTLIELAVVILLFALVVHGALNFFIISSNRFSASEKMIAFADASTTVFNHLRIDLEKLGAGRNGPLEFAEIPAVCSRKDDTVLIFSGINQITYTWDKQANAIKRAEASKVQYFGKGLIREFEISLRCLGSDGQIYNVWESPESAWPKGVNVIRIWLNVRTAYFSDKSNEAASRQEYVTNIYPVAFNRSLNSIWFQR